MRAAPKTLRNSNPSRTAHLLGCIREPIAVIVGVVLALAALATLMAPAARADTAFYGPGFHNENWSGAGFLGAFRVGGVNAYCLDFVSPPAHETAYENATTIIGTGDLDAHADSRLATLLRLYGDTTDDVTAAAVNLNVWTWLRGAPRSASWYAARAGSRAHDVLAAAAAQRTDVDARTALDTTAHSSIALADDASVGTVVTTLRARHLTGDADVPEGTVPVRVTLSGATFSRGTTEAILMNGVPANIVPDLTTAVVHVTAETVVDGLPHPRSLSLLGPETSGGQRLVRSSHSPVDIRTSVATIPRSSPLPWQPVVSTSSSIARDARPGTSVHDTIDVDAAPAQPGTLGVWAVDESLAPQSIEVVSELLGPFLGAELAVTNEWPINAPRACRVTTVVSAPGRYSTDSCTITSPGRYAWVESIGSSERRRPWKSPFGVPSEVLIAEWTPSITTEASAITTIDNRACVADTLSVTNVNPSARGGVRVTVDLLGPFPDKPTPDDTPNLADATQRPHSGEVPTRPAIASATVHVSRDGTFVTPCLDLPADQFGYYYFVWHHGGSDPDETGYQVIPRASDFRRHERETIFFSRTEPPLVATGNDAVNTITGGGIVTGIGAAIVGVTSAIRLRRRP